jgi:hypothetical protein
MGIFINQMVTRGHSFKKVFTKLDISLNRELCIE